MTVSCHKQPPATQPVTQQAQLPAGQPPALPSAEPSAPPDTTVAEKETRPEVTKEELGSDYTSDNTSKEGERENDKRLERDLADLRPKKVIPLQGSTVDLNFTGAVYNTTKGAQLSDLAFEMKDRELGLDIQWKVTDKNKDTPGKVNLGWCTLKVKTAISPPEVQPIGGGKTYNNIIRLGNYDITVLSEKGKPMATATLQRDRTLFAGPAQEGYQAWMARDREREDMGLYVIARVNADKSTTEVFKMRWNDSGFQRQQCDNGKGTTYIYSFPAGSLEIIKP
jgi:hypothetical protein